MTANHFIPIPYIIDIGRCCVIKAYQKNYRCKIKRYNCFPFLCSRFSVFCYFRFLFLLLFFFSSLAPQSWSLPPPLPRWFVFSLSQCCCPLLIFSSMFFLPHHDPLSPASPLSLCPHTPCASYSFSLSLSLCNVSTPPALFPPFFLSFPPMHPSTSLFHTLSLCLCGSWALCGDATPKTSLPVPLLFPWR